MMDTIGRRWLLVPALAALTALVTGGAPTASAAGGIDDALAPYAQVAPVSMSTTPRWDGDTLRLAVELPALAEGIASAQGFIGNDEQAVPAQVRLEQLAQAPDRTVILAIDTSGSMTADAMTAAREAAETFADTAGPRARIGLVAFADQARLVSDATSDRDALRSGLLSLRPSGETALYDAVVMATKAAGQGGSVLLLSDGADTVSRATLKRAVAAITSSGARFDVVALPTADSAEAPLRALAAAGRGQMVRASGAAGLGAAFDAAAGLVPYRAEVSLPAGQLPSGLGSLSVGLIVGSSAYRSAAASLPVRPGASAPSAAPPAGFVVAEPHTPWWRSMWLLGIVLCTALATSIGAAIWPKGATARLRERQAEALSAYDSESPDGAPRRKARLFGRGRRHNAAAQGMLNLTERAVGEGQRQGAIATRLDRGGISMAPHEWVALRTLAIAAASLSAAAVIRPVLLGGILGAVLGIGITEAWLRIKQARRCSAFADQLPDTLQLVASSLRSGFSLQHALGAAQEHGAEPMASELGRALSAARIGANLEDELDHIAVRLRSEDWRLTVMAIRIQRSVGGSLAEVLSTTARTMRERSAVARQVKALSAEGTLSAYILLALPVGVGGFLMLFRREYLSPLWTTAPGRVMLAVALLGMVVGARWMFSMVKVRM